MIRITQITGAAVALVLLGFTGTSNAQAACDRVASAGQSAQALVDSLTAGQTGCLRAGSYSQPMLRFNHGGSTEAPITLTSYPGERAELSGFVYVPSGSDNVTISAVDIDLGTSGASRQVGVSIMAADVIVERANISGRSLFTCMILGSNGGWGHAARVIVRESTFSDCGNPANGNQDHAIYVENATDVRIENNLFSNTSAYAIHLYPNAQRTKVLHNVIDGPGRGVIFGGDDSLASADNEVAFNLITNITLDYGVTSWWGGPVGTGNTVHHNCLFGNAIGDVGQVRGFTTAGNVQADPGYRDRGAHDYRLAADSPCLAAVGYDVAARLSAVTGSQARDAGESETGVVAERPPVSPPAADPGSRPSGSAPTTPCCPGTTPRCARGPRLRARRLPNWRTCLDRRAVQGADRPRGPELGER